MIMFETSKHDPKTEKCCCVFKSLIIVLFYIERNKKKSCFCFFTNGKQDKASELDMITLRNHAPRS